MESGTTILFGLPGVAVQRVERGQGGHGGMVRLVHMVTAASSAAGCPQCGVISTSVKQYRTTQPRDLPYSEEPLAVRWRKRQYRCREATCPRKAFTECIAGIPARARLTGRLCRQVARQIADGQPVPAVAARYQVSWPAAHGHYAGHADAVLTEPEPPAVLASARPAAGSRSGSRTSALSCSGSTTGAPAPTYPRSPPWPRRSRPGGRRFWPSWTPESPTPPPKPPTG
jgi:transposase